MTRSLRAKVMVVAVIAASCLEVQARQLMAADIAQDLPPYAELAAYSVNFEETPVTSSPAPVEATPYKPIYSTPEEDAEFERVTAPDYENPKSKKVRVYKSIPRDLHDPIYVHLMGGTGSEFRDKNSKDLRLAARLSSEVWTFGIELGQSDSTFRDMHTLGFYTGWNLVSGQRFSGRLIINSGFTRTYKPDFGRTGGLYLESGLGGYYQADKFELMVEYRARTSNESAHSRNDHATSLIGFAWRFR